MLIAVSMLTACTTPAPDGPIAVVDVQARYETGPFATDATAIDPAVWINEDNPGASLVVATDNTSGLHVYAIDGRMLDSEALGAFNNIDVIGLDRSGGTRRLLIGATSPMRSLLTVLAVDPASGEIESSPVAVKRLEFEPNAFCAVRLANGMSTAFASSATGELIRFNIATHRTGDVTIDEAARLNLGSGADACVANHDRRAVWIAQKGTGIWRLPLRIEPDSRPERVAEVDGRRLVSDVGGLAITRLDGQSLLLASSPADGSFAAFNLGSGRTQGGHIRAADAARLHGRFRVAASGDIDEVTASYGFATGVSSGMPGLPGGVLVVPDGLDQPGGGHNFKFIALDDIADAF